MYAELSLDHSTHSSHHVKGYFNKKEQHLGCKKKPPHLYDVDCLDIQPFAH